MAGSARLHSEVQMPRFFHLRRIRTTGTHKFMLFFILPVNIKKLSGVSVAFDNIILHYELIFPETNCQF